MPAGVHHPFVERLVVDIALFDDRQRVHVGAQGDDLARLAAAQDADHAGAPDAGLHLIDSQRTQPLGDELARLVLLKPELRMLVQETAIGDHSWQQLIDLTLHHGQFEDHNL